MADLVVTNVTPQIQFIYSSTTNTYSFPFAITNSSQIIVYVTPAGADANDANQVWPTPGYTVTINPPPAVGGSITFYVTPNSGDRVTIVRSTPILATSNYSNATLLSASSLNGSFNNDIMIAQESNAKLLLQCPSYNVSDVIDESDLVLPKLDNGTLWVKGVDANGNPAIVSQPIGNVVGGVVTKPIAPITAGNLTMFNDGNGNITNSGIIVDTTNSIIDTSALTLKCYNVNVGGNINLSAGTLTTSSIVASSGISTKNFNSTGNIRCTGNSTFKNITVNGILTAPNFNPTTIQATTIQATGNISGTTIAATGTVAGNQLAVQNSSGIVYIQNSSGNYTLTLPSNQTAGVLTNNGAGGLSWGASVAPARAFIKENIIFNKSGNISMSLVAQTNMSSLYYPAFYPNNTNPVGIKFTILPGIFSDNNYMIKACVTYLPITIVPLIDEFSKTSSTFIIYLFHEDTNVLDITQKELFTGKGCMLYVECT